jgi:phosphoribosyl 1,2-cyclic phosphate phosphodiesterase
MRFHLLGTSAGKTVPRPFCRCRVCEHARLRGGRDVRTRCAVHLYLDEGGVRDPRYAIDLSPDTPAHLIRHGLRLDRLEHLLITHAHGDHLEPDLLRIRPTVLGDRAAMPTLHIYGSQTVRETLGDWDHERMGTAFHLVEPGDAFAAGPLQVSSVRAHHGVPSIALHYILEHEATRVLLAWDTGWWSEATWKTLESQTFDAVISECTIFGPGAVDRSGSHLNFATLVEMKQRLTDAGAITPQTPWVTLHIGDNGGLTYAEQLELGAPQGVTPGHDGMWLRVPSTAP